MNEQTLILVSLGSGVFILGLTLLLGIILLTAMWLHKPESKTPTPGGPDLGPAHVTGDERLAWLAFCGTPVGKKIGYMLARAVTKSAVAATADAVTSAHSCGRACGVRDVVALLDSLLPEKISPAGAQPGNLEPSASQDAADPFAHLAP